MSSQMIPVKRSFQSAFLAFIAALMMLVWVSGCLPRDRCDIVCQNGGTCAGNHCICPDGCEGSRCEVDKVEKFRGSYAVKQNSAKTSPEPYAAFIERTGTEMKLAVKNMHNAFSLVAAEYHHDTLWINWDIGHDKKIIGKGTMESIGGKSVLKMYYKIADLASSTLEDYGYDNVDNAVVWEK